ncbi:MAG: alkaline phosphatase D family protein [Sandaracinaceae bacterium]
MRPADEAFPQSVASGDPRPDSIVLWTRVQPLDLAASAVVKIELYRDPELTMRVDLDTPELTASPDHDHCVRAKVIGLENGTRYYYRFEHDGSRSNVGQFRTPDREAANIPARFAVLSCQDFAGRYYNTLLRLLDGNHEDLSFVLHLGDYIYETTADPQFMVPSADRLVTFSHPEEAIPRGSGDNMYYAARSVSNYRDLYKLYRTDPLLRQLHEKVPFICIWDDHEFSDDSFGDTATYSDGVEVEVDEERRQNAEQVWLEYMPVARDIDSASGELTVDGGTLYPNNRIYRSFRFGQHLTLVCTDYRSYRPDHLIPEDAFPGHVVMTQADTEMTLARLESDGDIPDATAAFMEGGFRPYIDLEAAANADYKRAVGLLLTGGYMAEGVEASRAAELAAQYGQGNVDAGVINAMLADGRAGLPADLMALADIDVMDTTLERGVSYAMAGKSSLTGQVGARYLVIQRPFDLICAWRARVQGDTAFDDAYGAEQEAWLRQTIADAETTWIVLASSVCNTSHTIDLEPFASMLPPALPATRYHLNVDEWDGFTERRRRLMEEVYRPNNVVIVAGDIHGAYATEFDADTDGNRAFELVTSSVSSGPFAELLINTGNSVPAIRDSGLLEGFVGNIDGLMTVANMPRLKFARSEVNGVLVVSANEINLDADFHILDGDIARPRNADAPNLPPNYYDEPEGLSSQWEHFPFRVEKVGGRNGPIEPRE